MKDISLNPMRTGNTNFFIFNFDENTVITIGGAYDDFYVSVNTITYETHNENSFKNIFYRKILSQYSNAYISFYKTRYSIYGDNIAVTFEVSSGVDAVMVLYMKKEGDVWICSDGDVISELPEDISLSSDIQTFDCILVNETQIVYAIFFRDYYKDGDVKIGTSTISIEEISHLDSIIEPASSYDFDLTRGYFAIVGLYNVEQGDVISLDFVYYNKDIQWMQNVYSMKINIDMLGDISRESFFSAKRYSVPYDISLSEYLDCECLCKNNDSIFYCFDDTLYSNSDFNFRYFYLTPENPSWDNIFSYLHWDELVENRNSSYIKGITYNNDNDSFYISIYDVFFDYYINRSDERCQIMKIESTSIPIGNTPLLLSNPVIDDIIDQYYFESRGHIIQGVGSYDSSWYANSDGSVIFKAIDVDYIDGYIFLYADVADGGIDKQIPPFLLISNKIKGQTAQFTPAGESAFQTLQYIQHTTFNNEDVSVKISPKDLGKDEDKEDYDFKVLLKNTITNKTNPQRVKPLEVILPNILQLSNTDFDETSVGDLIKISSHYADDSLNEFYFTYLEFKENKYIVLSKKVEDGKFYITLNNPFPNYKNKKFEYIMVEKYNYQDVIMINHFHIRGNPIVETMEKYVIQDKDSVDYYGEKTYTINGKLTDFNYLRSLAEYIMYRHKGGYVIDEQFEEQIKNNVPICTFKVHKLLGVREGDVIKVNESVYFMPVVNTEEKTFTVIKKKITLSEFDEITAIYTPLTKQYNKLTMERTDKSLFTPISSTDPTAYLTSDQVRTLFVTKENSIGGGAVAEKMSGDYKFIKTNSDNSWHIAITKQLPSIDNTSTFIVKFGGKEASGRMNYRTATQVDFVPMPVTNPPNENSYVEIIKISPKESTTAKIDVIGGMRVCMPTNKTILFNQSTWTRSGDMKIVMFVNYSLYETPSFISENPALYCKEANLKTSGVIYSDWHSIGTLAGSGFVPDDDKTYVIKVVGVLKDNSLTPPVYISYDKKPATLYTEVPVLVIR